MKHNLNVIISIINVLKINLIITKFKFLSSKNKIIFIYHPSRSLTLNHKDYLDDLFNSFEKNYLIIYGHQKNDVNEKNYFFINHGLLLNWIFKVDIFLSTNICDVFTKNSIKIYMHHDIYDTPLVSEDKQKELFKRIKKYDHIFLPNNVSVNMFQNFFKKNNNNKNSSLPELIETGYLKLDFLHKKKESYKINEKKHIIIAPTNFIAFPHLAIDDYLEKMIEILINKTDSHIIYRPHPSNKNHPKTLKILEKFKNNKKFSFDDSIDYFENYIKSYCMITDLSGTAYTYAFFTNQPVIFFSKNEQLIKDFNYYKLSYFKDRNKIGVIAKNINQIINSLTNIKDVMIETNNSISNLKKNMIYFGKSKERIKSLIYRMLN